MIDVLRCINKFTMNYFSFRTSARRLIATEVTSLEDVYWLEDSRAMQILGKDFTTWNQVRQKLPTSKSQLEALKAELWSTVVKTSNHQDAWTYGGMLVVSVSVAGLVIYSKLNVSISRVTNGKSLFIPTCTNNMNADNLGSHDRSIVSARSTTFIVTVCYGKVSDAIKLSG